MMMKKFSCLLLALAAALQSAHAADWKMDAAASRLDFAATFEKAPAPGVFKEFNVQLGFDPDKPAGGRLDVTIRTASADMSSADINKAIAGPEWFDFAKHPQAEFHATDIRAAASGYVARGTLALKGVQQAVEVPFTWKADGDGATMDGQFVVKRTAFGIGTGEWLATDVIGPDVTVKFRVRLRKVG
ncbi:YceI family protein [Variovorax sp. J22R133]|uniref:YceI family protein n=1 Tax=Variovorax brevis TaxID=3053503 RepID=UPI0025756468|nr:YceI family protein [Variovorax sp. J22R133]MDM0112725.1 YceI family protein [Variovorax sp. J22R133]